MLYNKWPQNIVTISIIIVCTNNLGMVIKINDHINNILKNSIDFELEQEL